MISQVNLYDNRSNLGAQPKLFGSQATNRPSLAYTNLDIEKSSPRSYVMEVHKPSLCLDINDIQGSSPQVNKFLSSRKASNPLNPIYQLAQVDIKPATPPKFIKDTLKTDDIEYSKPRSF